MTMHKAPQTPPDAPSGAIGVNLARQCLDGANEAMTSARKIVLAQDISNEAKLLLVSLFAVAGANLEVAAMQLENLGAAND